MRWTRLFASLLAVAAAEHYKVRPAHWKQHGPPPWAQEREHERGWEREHGHGHEGNRGHDGDHG